MVNEVKKAVYPQPIFKAPCEGSAKVTDLPLRDGRPGTQAVSHVFDIMLNTDHALITADLLDDFRKHEYPKFPPPFCPARHVDFPYQMDIITIPEQNGKTTILKHFSSMAGSRIPWELAASLCTGEARVLDLRGMVPKVAMKALELMKDKLGGAQLRNFFLTSIVAPPHPPVAPSR